MFNCFYLPHLISQVSRNLLGREALTEKEILENRQKIVGKFICKSQPIENELIRAWIGNYMFNQKLDENNLYIDELPSNKLVKISFGESLQFHKQIFIPCQKEPFIFGTYDWDTGIMLNAQI